MSSAAAAALWAVPLVIAWLWRPRQAPSPSAWILLIAFGMLGAWAVWFGLYAHPGEPAAFVFWKPTVLYWALAAIMIIAALLGLGYPVKILLGTYFALSNREWRWMNFGFAALFTIVGAVNLWVASAASYQDWVGFKYSCMMTLLIVVLFRLNFVWLPLLADVSIYIYRRVSAACRYLSSLI
ncbi:MAG: septation protein IspZ [Steroidobacteraceae bacterium]|jgi:intracellular septation protein